MKKSILLTGATGNLGNSVLRKLSDAGFHVLATARSTKSASALQNEQANVTVLDITDENAVSAYIQSIKADTNIQAAVLLAGGFLAGNLAFTGQGALQQMFNLNFETSFYLVRELLPVFEKQGGGRFILIGSRAALDPDEGHHLAAYALSKGLIFQLADLINAYGRDKKIDATVIVPSIIDTPGNRAAIPKADFSTWVSPESIANMIHFVLSDTGQQMRKTTIKLYNNS